MKGIKKMKTNSLSLSFPHSLPNPRLTALHRSSFPYHRYTSLASSPKIRYVSQVVPAVRNDFLFHILLAMGLEKEWVRERKRTMSV